MSRSTSEVTGKVTFEGGTLSEPLSGELSAAALRWALQHRDTYGLPATSSLRVTNAFQTRFGASIHLQQTVAGVDVDTAELVVTVDKTARVSQVAAGLQPYASMQMGFAMSADDALARAAKAVPLPKLSDDGKPVGGFKKVAIAVGNELHAAYVTRVLSVDPRANWFVAIDATTGAVLWKQNRVHHAALDAQVYRSSPGGLDGGVGVTPTIAATLTHGDGGSMVRDNDGGFLVGTQLDAYNCCINTDCNLTYETYPDGGTDGGPFRAKGSTTIPFMGFNVPITYDVAACQRRPVASNDVSRHASGDYVYTPHDPPDAGPIVQTDPANSDEFVEVHSFFHVNQVYDWVRGLSVTANPLFPGHQPALTPFQMRDERMGKKPAVWSNVVFPNFQELLGGGLGGLQCIQNPPCRINTLLRIPNAAFVPVDQAMALPLPELRNDVDTLMIFQGAEADFGYDAPVLWHEFGHGAVYATAGLTFDSLAIDERSANNESGALHEGFADYIAGAFGNDSLVGKYVGPRLGVGGGAMGVRQDGYLRDLNNTMSCPGVLQGEVHEDSQHISAAFWDGRKALMGTDMGKKFDATFYAMLVSLPARADFAAVAQSMVMHVSTSFDAAASTQMQGFFTTRGVTGCSKVLEVNQSNLPRPMYGIGGLSQAPEYTQGSTIPGPYQMLVKAPNGARSLTLTGRTQASGLSLGQATYNLKVVANVGAPISFTKQGNQLLPQASAVSTTINVANDAFNTTLDLVNVCTASDIYVSIVNLDANAATVGQVGLAANAGCNLPDAGTGGGAGGGGGATGGGAGGGSTETVTVPEAPDTLGNARPGCGCTAMGGEALVGLVLLALVRARRKDGR